MKKTIFTILLTSLLLLPSCKSKDEENLIIKSPNEDSGLEGNASDDKVEAQDASVLKDLLLQASAIEYYTYEITCNVIGNQAHFYNYVTPYAWYEENEDYTTSFGKAQEGKNGAVFKFYLNEEGNEVIPSVYEYEGYNNLIKTTELYSELTFTHINLFSKYANTFSAISAGYNKFLITDGNTQSIFQFMSTYGYSIAQHIVSVYVEIIDAENLVFNSILDLGQYGTITGKFTPTSQTKINFVSDLAKNKQIRGIDSHEDVKDFFENKIELNNFVLHGMATRSQQGNVPSKFVIHCTEKYFYLEYNEEYINLLPDSEKAKCISYGYVLVPKGTEVTYQELQSSGIYVSKTQTLDYDACYKFRKGSNSSFFFDGFVGPLESSGLDFLEVDSLPATGQENIIYIVKEDNKKVTYVWYKETGYSLYTSSWFDSVGDFYLNNGSASFYLSATPLIVMGPLYYEKSLSDDNLYFTDNIDILTHLANGLFGWGFQATDTWMDYIQESTLRVNKDSLGNINSYEIGLTVLAMVQGSAAGLQEVYYTIDSFNQADHPMVAEFLNSKLGGGY